MDDSERNTIVWRLLEEFRHFYGQNNQEFPANTNAVVVLSVHDSEKENRARIAHASVIWHKIIKKNGWTGSLPEFIINAEKEQLSLMCREAKLFGIPTQMIYQQNAGTRGLANTKTQFEVLSKECKRMGWHSLVLVTSTYHVPRVRRTASKLLPSRVEYYTLGIPNDREFVNTFQKVIGEIDRIVAYYDKGDIHIHPRM